MSLELSDLSARLNLRSRRVDLWKRSRGIGLKQTGQEETRWRNRAGGINTAAAAAEQQRTRYGSQPKDFPI
jgi:hypothetical protein